MKPIANSLLGTVGSFGLVLLTTASAVSAGPVPVQSEGARVTGLHGEATWQSPGKPVEAVRLGCALPAGSVVSTGTREPSW